jgi:predicted adenine nucleotide alpha hydrolase (AANH) superfamily ATPase
MVPVRKSDCISRIPITVRESCRMNKTTACRQVTNGILGYTKKVVSLQGIKLKTFMCMDSILVTPKDKSQSATVKKILRALDVPFRETDSPYNPEFVEKIRQSEKEIEEGKVTRIGTEEELAEFLGLKK